MQKLQMFIIILQKYAHTFVYFDIFLYLCSRNRVRQLVAMVHTTPLNGRAPNASALRSDYRCASSPPEMLTTNP